MCLLNLSVKGLRILVISVIYVHHPALNCFFFLQTGRDTYTGQAPCLRQSRHVGHQGSALRSHSWSLDNSSEGERRSGSRDQASVHQSAHLVSRRTGVSLECDQGPTEAASTHRGLLLAEWTLENPVGAVWVRSEDHPRCKDVRREYLGYQLQFLGM